MTPTLREAARALLDALNTHGLIYSNGHLWSNLSAALASEDAEIEALRCVWDPATLTGIDGEGHKVALILRDEAESVIDALRAERDAHAQRQMEAEAKVFALLADVERLNEEVEENERRLLASKAARDAAEDRAERAERGLTRLTQDYTAEMEIARQFEPTLRAAEAECSLLRARCAEVEKVAADLLEACDRAVSDQHSPWCNGVHEQGVCEGDYLMNRFLAEKCAALARTEGRDPSPEVKP
jgi:hypothetical protein